MELGALGASILTREKSKPSRQPRRLALRGFDTTGWTDLSNRRPGNRGHLYRIGTGNGEARYCAKYGVLRSTRVVMACQCGTPQPILKQCRAVPGIGPSETKFRSQEFKIRTTFPQQQHHMTTRSQRPFGSHAFIHRHLQRTSATCAVFNRSGAPEYTDQIPPDPGIRKPTSKVLEAARTCGSTAALARLASDFI